MLKLSGCLEFVLSFQGTEDGRYRNVSGISTESLGSIGSQEFAATRLRTTRVTVDLKHILIRTLNS